MVLDGGNSLAPVARAKTPVGEEVLAQRRVKAELIADAWKLGGIDGVALGASDWALGADWVREMVEARALPVLAANLTCAGAAPFPGGRVVQVGGRRIGLVGVTEGEVPGCEVGDAAEAVRRAVAELGPTDVVIGLVPLELGELAKLTGPESGLDLAITGGARPPADAAVPAFVAGSRGRQVGVLELAWTGSDRWVRTGQRESIAARVERTESRLRDTETRLSGSLDAAARARFEKQRVAYQEQIARDRAFLAGVSDGGGNTVAEREVQLGEEIPDDPATAPLVSAAKDRVGAVAASGGGNPLAVPHRVPAGSAWAGSDACAGCHRAEHAQWAGTPHAHALGTLVGVNRNADESCWSCHVTGANQPGGPASAAEIGPFRDVQCEACHGPSSAHVADPAGARPVRVPPVGTCTTCHDGEQDQGRFDAASYLPKVDHRAP